MSEPPVGMPEGPRGSSGDERRPAHPGPDFIPAGHAPAAPGYPIPGSVPTPEGPPDGPPRKGVRNATALVVVAAVTLLLVAGGVLVYALVAGDERSEGARRSTGLPVGFPTIQPPGDLPTATTDAPTIVPPTGPPPWPAAGFWLTTCSGLSGSLFV